MMLIKGQGRPTYLLSKNSQIRLWHRRLGYTSNTKVVEPSKLNNGIDIIIEDDLLIENLSSDSEIDNKDKCKDLGQIFTTNNEHERLSPLIAIINNSDNDEIEKLYNPCSENMHIKTVRYKKMTPTTRKLQEIHADL